MALFRRSRGDGGEPETPPAADPLAAVDRAAVPPALLPTVDRAVACAQRYRALAATRPSGPVQDRLALLGVRVDQGVLAVYENARQAAHLDAVAATLDVDAATAALKDARRRGASPELVEIHRARFESVQRVLNARDGIDERLEVLVARLEASVARAAELTLTPTTDLDAVETDLADVTDELEALRAGLDALA